MLRLRQIALAASDLAAAEGQLKAALDLQLCYRDPNVAVFGLKNALFPIGDQFLEIVSPQQDGTSAGRLLERRGDCGYMVLFQVDDLGPVTKRIADAGIRVVYDAAGEGIRGLHLHPRDVPGAIVSIDAADQPAEWPWAGRGWREHVRTTTAHAIVAMEVSVADPLAACATWSRLLGVSADGSSLRLDDATVRFVDPKQCNGREGIVALDLATRDPAIRGSTRELLGVSLRFVAGG